MKPPPMTTLDKCRRVYSWHPCRGLGSPQNCPSSVREVRPKGSKPGQEPPVPPAQASRQSQPAKQAEQAILNAPPKLGARTIPPPRYRMYRQDPNSGLVAMVVDTNTTEEQLKSLLWFFRQKVRSQRLRDLNVRSELEGSGIILVYRGARCAYEQFTDQLGPCGYGDHNSAFIQWGISGDAKKDTAALVGKNGEMSTVFDYSDGWQLPAEDQTKLQADREQRENFAVALLGSFENEGLDIVPSVDDMTLDLDSKSFEDGSTHRAFVRQMFSERNMIKQLCDKGFRSLKVGHLKGILEGEVGERFSLGCR